MARINNTNTIKRILDDAKIQTSVDDVPQELGKTVVPVLISNPKGLITASKSLTRTATQTIGTIFTTRDDVDTYIHGALLSLQRDAVSTATDVTISCIVDGATVTLAMIELEPLTADSKHLAVSFPVPIKVDRGTAVRGGPDASAAVMTTTSIVLIEEI